MLNGTFRFLAMEEVIYGRPAAEAVAELAGRLEARRVFVLASGTLNRETGEVARLKAALGDLFAGVHDRMPAHTPRDAVLAAAAAARAADADLIVTFGGGSATDGGKLMQICLRHGLTRIEDLDAYRIRVESDGRRQVPRFDGPVVRQVTVPTTLSAGEFNPLAGCTDPRRKVKEAYSHPLLVPRAVILDPAPTVHTPQWLWLSTGVRAVDHAVEGLCSARPNPYCDGAAMQALRLLGEGLPRVKADPADLEARLLCQIGAWLSMTGRQADVPMGASHGIGHVLGGTCDVPHGHTSCVMLPYVLRWNAPVNRERQRLVSAAFGRPEAEAADVLHDFIAGLGMPRTLREVGVGEDRFTVVAENAMHDPWVHSNPRTIRGPEDVAEILRMAA
jgi:maleylacetate reductase